MNPVTSAAKTAMDASFWMDAVTVIVGHKGSDALNNLIGGFVPVPAAVKPFVGPAATLVAAKLIGGRHGRNLAVGALVNAASTVFKMVGVPFLGE